MLKVDGDKDDLDLLFVSPKAHSKGIGYAAWCAVEKLHPEVKIVTHWLFLAQWVLFLWYHLNVLLAVGRWILFGAYRKVHRTFLPNFPSSKLHEKFGVSFRIHNHEKYRAD